MTFISITHFPPLKPGQEAAFQEWFAWSSRAFAEHKGFLRRRLFRNADSGHYFAIVEFQDEGTFTALEAGPAYEEAEERLKPLLASEPTALYGELVAE